MNAEIKDGKLIITIDAILPPRPSNSGKKLLVATTGGNKATNLLVDGKYVTIGLNAYIDR